MRNQKKYISILWLLFLILVSCNKSTTTFAIKNTLDVTRSNETVSMTKEFLHVESLQGIGVKNLATQKLEVTQQIDVDGDGTIDEIIFQPTLAPLTTETFEIVSVTEKQQPKAEDLCYSRFVPERTDDYTWENDKVAFRVYGPTAQRLIEENKPGGTLSSGIDGWLKRVNYPIINKWYAEHDENPGAYHKDSGEGLDNFHVGVSRGIGGLAVKEEGEYYFSKNYTEWRTITTGPLRTSFYLKYADWKAGNKTITEYKIITLDKGSNLSKIETYITGTDQVSVGLTLHKQEGNVDGNVTEGWISYWEPLGDSEIGTGIVAANSVLLNQETYLVDELDLCNTYADLKVTDNKVTYYSGFGWKKAGEFKTEEMWKKYLNGFKVKLDNPLQITLKR
ncbi:DUF4861 family protein [Wenyingzhuangia sp. 2_MG-2023]|uniref:DUF4861 family protein n=1 Tax=Wenyingzhuangia sp. 2_MG-2023 TaxID=3062639 RepID=UPI0026E37902|nr:DUF4861 family protein [Wenyingzhuangia sp. 2_MG-2023]MDO6738817.1 DUF4861 family protein [Wenyingzhuangia sp. 2_MG-2023]